MESWKYEEALLLARDGLVLSTVEEARMQLDIERPRRPLQMRRSAAAALLALARRLDPEALSTPVAAAEHAPTHAAWTSPA